MAAIKIAIVLRCREPSFASQLRIFVTSGFSRASFAARLHDRFRDKSNRKAWQIARPGPDDFTNRRRTRELSFRRRGKAVCGQSAAKPRTTNTRPQGVRVALHYRGRLRSWLQRRRNAENAAVSTLLVPGSCLAHSCYYVSSRGVIWSLSE